MKRVIVVAALSFVASAGFAVGAPYAGYVPKGFASMGETFEGSDASQILSCKTESSSELHSKLSREAAREWYGMCANANKVHQQLVAGNCFRAPPSPACRVGINADNAIRRDPEFWHVLNALMGRADDYGLDD